MVSISGQSCGSSLQQHVLILLLRRAIGDCLLNAIVASESNNPTAYLSDANKSRQCLSLQRLRCNVGNGGWGHSLLCASPWRQTLCHEELQNVLTPIRHRGESRRRKGCYFCTNSLNDTSDALSDPANRVYNTHEDWLARRLCMKKKGVNIKLDW